MAGVPVGNQVETARYPCHAAVRSATSSAGTSTPLRDTPWGYKVGDVRDRKAKENTMATITKNYTVDGMTCGHCKASVEEEIGEIVGVTSVEAELATGRVTVTGEDVQDDAVTDAVTEAGYSVRA